MASDPSDGGIWSTFTCRSTGRAAGWGGVREPRAPCATLTVLPARVVLVSVGQRPGAGRPAASRARVVLTCVRAPHRRRHAGRVRVYLPCGARAGQRARAGKACRVVPFRDRTFARVEGKDSPHWCRVWSRTGSGLCQVFCTQAARFPCRGRASRPESFFVVHVGVWVGRPGRGRPPPEVPGCRLNPPPPGQAYGCGWDTHRITWGPRGLGGQSSCGRGQAWPGVEPSHHRGYRGGGPGARAGVMGGHGGRGGTGEGFAGHRPGQGTGQVIRRHLDCRSLSPPRPSE